MTTIAWIVIFKVLFGAACGFGGARIYKLYQEKKAAKALPTPAVNVIEGIVFPDPIDPRWYLETDGYARLGNVAININGYAFYTDHGVEGSIPCDQNYFDEIKKGIAQRIAEDAIINAKMPPKKIIKSKRVKELEAEVKSLKDLLNKPKQLAPYTPQSTATLGYSNGSLYTFTPNQVAATSYSGVTGRWPPEVFRHNRVEYNPNTLLDKYGHSVAYNELNKTNNPDEWNHYPGTD